MAQPTEAQMAKAEVAQPHVAHDGAPASGAAPDVGVLLEEAAIGNDADAKPFIFEKEASGRSPCHRWQSKVSLSGPHHDAHDPAWSAAQVLLASVIQGLSIEQIVQEVVDVAQVVFQRDLHSICTKERHAQAILHARLTQLGFRVENEGDIVTCHEELPDLPFRRQYDLLINGQVRLDQSRCKLYLLLQTPTHDWFTSAAACRSSLN